ADAATSSGYSLWPLNNAAEPGLFRIELTSGAVDTLKLRQSLQALTGIGGIDIKNGADGQTLSISKGKVRADAIISAAGAAGFNLSTIQPPVALLTLQP